MFKVRLILGALIVGLMVGFYVLSQSALPVGGKLLIAATGTILYLAACVMMIITFFTLDEHGQIPRGSLAYQYFATFYDKDDKAPEGEMITIKGTPDRINLCPAFWMVAAGFFVVLIIIAALSLFGFFLFSVVFDVYYARETAVAMMVTAPLIIGVIALFAGAAALVMLVSNLLRNKRFLQKVFWVAAACSMLGLVALSFYLIPPHYAPNLSAEEARASAVTTAGITVGVIAGILAGPLFLIGLGFLLSRWMRNSIVGRLILALYHKTCPQLPIEPKPHGTQA